MDDFAERNTRKEDRRAFTLKEQPKRVRERRVLGKRFGYIGIGRMK